MSSKPSILENLSPKDILKIWLILDPDEKMEFYAKLVDLQKNLVSPEFQRQAPAQDTGSFFSYFAQIFQGFNRLRNHLDTALERKNTKEFKYYLLGNEVDSLPSLLATADKQKDFDPVFKYILALSAKDILKKYTAKESMHNLKDKIEALMQAKSQIDLGKFKNNQDKFYDWFEKAFLTTMKTRKRSAPEKSR